MQDIINNLKILKIHRDIIFIKKQSNIFYKKNLLNSVIYKNKKYYKLLRLIKNIHLYHIVHHNSSDNISINFLKNIDINLFEFICNYENINIVDTPTYERLVLENNVAIMKREIVNNTYYRDNIDILFFFKKNNNKIIYLYVIFDNIIRCKLLEDLEYLKKSRKEKILKIKKEYI